MLYFICFTKYGFATDTTGRNFAYDVRLAQPFTSFAAADTTAKAMPCGGTAFAILANCIG